MRNAPRTGYIKVALALRAYTRIFGWKLYSRRIDSFNILSPDLQESRAVARKPRDAADVVRPPGTLVPKALCFTADVFLGRPNVSSEGLIFYP